MYVMCLHDLSLEKWTKFQHFPPVSIVSTHPSHVWGHPKFHGFQGKPSQPISGHLSITPPVWLGAPGWTFPRLDDIDDSEYVEGSLLGGSSVRNIFLVIKKG